MNKEQQEEMQDKTNLAILKAITEGVYETIDKLGFPALKATSYAKLYNKDIDGSIEE